jgi:ribonuclease HII
VTARRRPRIPAPDAAREHALRREGARLVAGVDEVGKGSWAGPLVVGAVVLRDEVLDAAEPAAAIGDVRDSKRVAERRRETIYDEVVAGCLAHATGAATAAECDALGMTAAQRLAAGRAMSALAGMLGRGVDAAVVDGRWDFVSPHASRVETLVRADATCVSVAAASIIAKVTRDRAMRALARELPHWAFESSKGYPCPRHREGLRVHGASREHRTTWAFMSRVG